MRKQPSTDNASKKLNNNSESQEERVPENIQDNNIFYVGIGASAGGLEALKEMITNINFHDNIVYIVAQHLSPTHKSMMVELIARTTDLSVKGVEDGVIPEPNVIYITPPSSDVYIQDGIIRIRNPLSEYAPKPSVDYFFSTLAESYGEKAIGVILSGTGSDGSHGVRAIRAMGGLTIAQDPETAKYNGMPSNAIDTGCIDLILSPQLIGKEIYRITSGTESSNIIAIDYDEKIDDIRDILKLLKQRTGVDFKNYKNGTITRRLGRRIIASNSGNISNYLQYIKTTPAELDCLFQDITITVTDFFRDRSSFEQIANYIEKIINSKKAGEQIRIWVPGCATGEEAYSIAILLAEQVGGIGNINKYNFQIFATDIDNEALDRARKGIYAAALLKNVDTRIQSEYFIARDNRFEVRKALREMVIFSRHNVFEDPPFLRLDMISCRNLLIYLNNKLQQHVFNLFHYALLPNGTLFLGKSESIGHANSLFQVVDSKNKIFQRKLITTHQKDNVIKSPHYSVFNKSRTEATIDSNSKVFHELPDAYIRALSPNSLLINENMDIIRIYGNVQPYISLSPGSATMNLMSLAREEFVSELKARVFRLLRENSGLSSFSKRMNIEREQKIVEIKIYSVNLKSNPEKLILVSFEQKDDKQDDEGNIIDSDHHPIMSELESELSSTREHLQTVIEELETSNEELQSTNEELQSSNEELQSTNEELETANEELQSTNEELITVNDELQIKSTEMNSLNEDLENIKESIDFALLVVDKNLKIVRYNRAVREIFILSDQEHGEVITSIPTKIHIDNLRDNILQVIQSGEILSREIESGEHSYIERILPFRDINNDINGAVITYLNNTEANKLAKKLILSEERYALATKGANAGIWDWNLNSDELYFSSVLNQILGISDDEAMYDFSLFKRIIHPEDRNDVISILNAHLERGFDFNVECRLRRNNTGYIWAHIKGQAEWDDNYEPVRMAGSVYDVTERKRAMHQLMLSNESLERFAYICSHDLKEPARIVENFAHLLNVQYGEQLDEQAKKYLEHIEDSSKRMQEMIKDILNYSQIEHKTIHLEDVDCKEEIKKVLKSLKLSVSERNVKVEIDDLPVIQADRMQIFQLFLNLVSNAVKFTDKEDPIISIGCKEERDFWKFFVKDNGIGMEKSYAKKIFQVFQRLNSSEKYSGNGIGLSICKRVIEKHNGKIWVESSPGEGAIFYFTLPKRHRKGNYESEQAA